MGRRNAINGLADLLTGFNQGYSTVGRVVQDKKLGDIANATPQQSQGYTADDGQQLEAIANAKDENGNPYYKLTANPDGSYTVADANNPSSSGVIAQHGVTDFLGQRSDGQMTPGQVENARTLAAAGVIGATDPVTAMRMRRDIMVNDREDQRFAWEKDRTERDLRLGAQKEADDQLLRGIDADAGDWLQGRLKGSDGTARAANIDDHLAATQYRAAKLAEAGKLDEASQVYKDYGVQSLAKIQLEGQQREAAIGKTAAALASGDLNAVKDFYNQFIPDGAHVTDVQRGKDGSITIQRETLDGRKLAPTVMKDTGQLVSALAAFKDPMAIYSYSQNEFRNTLAARADARAGAAEARAGAEFKAGQPQRDLAGTVATLQLGMANAQTPEEQEVIRSKLMATQGMGGKGTPPTGYRWTSSGNLEAIPGGPGDKNEGKPMPAAAASGLLTNQQNLRRAQSALALISGEKVGNAKGDKEATGMKGYLPNGVLNRVDPAGVETRAAIADLASLVIHDRSGAAVTAAEFPRLAPFIPTEKDDAATVRKKLNQFVKNYQAQIDETADFYKGMGYKVPTEKLKDADVKPADKSSDDHSSLWRD